MGRDLYDKVITFLTSHCREWLKVGVGTFVVGCFFLRMCTCVFVCVYQSSLITCVVRVIDNE